MANRNDIFIGLAIFYSIFFGLLGFAETGITTSTSNTINESTGFLNWVSTNSDVGSSVIGFFETIFYNISGMPAILQVIIFTPLTIMGIWLLIDLIVWVTPFIGGGS